MSDPFETPQPDATDRSGDYEIYRRRASLAKAREEFQGKTLADFVKETEPQRLSPTQIVQGAAQQTKEVGEGIVREAAQMPRAVVGGLLSETPKRFGALADDLTNLLIEDPRVFQFRSGQESPETVDVESRLFRSLADKVSPDIAKPSAPVARFVRDATPFFTALIPLLGPATRIAEGVTSTATRAELLAAAGAGGVADFATVDTANRSLLGMLAQYQGLQEPALAVLEAPEETPASGLESLERRFVLAAEGIGLGAISDLTLRGIRFLRVANARARQVREVAKPESMVREIAAKELDLDAGTALLEKRSRDEGGRFVAREAPRGDAQAAFERARASIRERLGEDASTEDLERLARLARAENTAAELQRRLGRPIRWESQDTPDSIAKLFDDTIAAFSDDVAEARRGVRTAEQTERAADLLGMTPTTLLRRRKGQAFNAEEVRAAGALVQVAGARLEELSRLAANPTSSPVDQIRFMRMFTTYKAMVDEFMGVRAEAGRAVEAFKRALRPEEGNLARKISFLVQESGGEAHVRRMADAVEGLFSSGASPGKITGFVERSWFLRPFDAFRESVAAGHLWNPATHVVNLATPYFNAANMAAERELAAQLGRFSMREFGTRAGFGGGESLGRVAPGEGLASLYGLSQAVGDLFRAASAGARQETGLVGRVRGGVEGIRNARAETGQLPLSKADPSTLNKITSAFLIPEFAKPFAERTGLAWGVDAFGKVTRFPFEALGVEDDLGRVIGYRMEVHALAYRQAYREWEAAGRVWDKETFGERVAELTTNPPKEVREAAQQAGAYLTFTNEAGKITKAFQTLSQVPVAGVLALPYVKTPANIIRYSLERTPLAPLMQHVRDDIAAGGAQRDVALARISLGSMALLGMLDAADAGFVTGTFRDLDEADRNTLLRNGVTPNSVRLGDKWIALNRLDQVGNFVSIAGDLHRLARTYDMDPESTAGVQEIVAAALTTTYNLALSKTWLLGVSRTMDALRHGEGTLVDFMNQQVTSAVPFESALRTARGIAQEAGGEETTRPEVNSAWDAVRSMIPELEATLTRSRDLWGNPIPASSIYGSIYDTFSPVRVTREERSILDREMRFHEAGVVRMRKRGQTVGGVEVDFHKHPRVYEILEQLAGGGREIEADLREDASFYTGRTTYEYLTDIVTGNDPLSGRYQDVDSDGKAALIATIVTRSRRLAKLKLLDPDFRPGDPDLVRFRAEIARAQDRAAVGEP